MPFLVVWWKNSAKTKNSDDNLCIDTIRNRQVPLKHTIDERSEDLVCFKGGGESIVYVYKYCVIITFVRFCAVFPIICIVFTLFVIDNDNEPIHNVWGKFPKRGKTQYEEKKCRWY